MTNTKIAVVIPAYEAEKTLRSAVHSVLEQEIEVPIEICIAVAPSKDGTFELAKEIESENDNIKVLENHTGLTPVGLNMAIRATSSTIIVRLDAHAEFEDGYFYKAVEALESTKSANVGGMQKPSGETAFEKAVGIATSSRFGAGDARFRIGGKAGPVDTVYLGVFERKALESVGLYDETLVRNQDAELNWRLRESGRQVWFQPELVTRYKPRSDLKSLARQYFGYGQWRRHVIKMHPKSLRLRQIISPLTIIFISVALITGIFWSSAFLIPVVYVTGVFSASINTSKNLQNFIYLLAIFPTIHFCWGAGFLCGVKKFT